METAVCSVALVAVVDSTLLLHLGHRTVKGFEGTFISSNCSRDEHFGQTIIIVVVRESDSLLNHAQHGARFREI